MDDYDPTEFRKTRGEVAGAWAVCTILFAAIFFGSFFSSSADHKRKTASLAMTNLPDVVQVSVPARQRAVPCE